MLTFEKEYFNLGYLDALSYKDSFIHRLDPRVKVITTFLFILNVVSFHKYMLTGLAPLFLFPVMLISLGAIPAGFILKKTLLVAPFALFIGIFNPFFDTKVIYSLYGISFTGGWLSFLSIVLKFMLTISAALLLIATTSFTGVCHALQRLGVPEVFTSQLLFLYRYIFVLMEETMKILRARDMRSFGKKGRGIRVFVNLAGVLFLRTMERAERIYKAMLARGFNGKISSVKKYSLTAADICFFSVTLTAQYLFRAYDITDILGRFIAAGLTELYRQIV